MPELPEVQTVCQNLSTAIIKKQINNINISDKKLRFPYPDNFSTIIKNKKISFIQRRARYILVNLSENLILLFHLGMTGKLLIENHLYNPQKHDHLIINFTDNTKLIYNDQRRFGFIDLFPKYHLKSHKMLSKLGVEPLSDEFNIDYLLEKLKNKQINIKTTMMDNKIVVGVGNIYINEALFYSKINPETKAGDLSLNKAKILIKNIKNILTRAIKDGGSSIKNYVNSTGDLGNYQSNFLIYGKKDENCQICDSKIKKMIQNGRSTFFCSKCQI